MSVFKKDESMPVLSREEILAVDDIQIEQVPVPEWGGDVLVKGMTGSERDRFEAGVISFGGDKGKGEKIDMRDLRAKLCSKTICDEGGKLLFSQSDVKELSKKSAIALHRVFKVAQRLSGLTDDDMEELREGLEDRPFVDSAFD